ncbi:MAG: SDR family NAD(P)-dependent oxidoreductase, partial [bacterium]
MSFAEWKRVMDTNIDSVFLAARAAARAMIAQGSGGSIITAASGAGRRGGATLARDGDHAGIADHDVKAAQMAQCLGHGMLDRRFVGGVAGEVQDPVARGRA